MAGNPMTNCGRAPQRHSDVSLDPLTRRLSGHSGGDQIWRASISKLREQMSVPHGARRWLGTGVITYPIQGGLELSPGSVGAVDFGD